MKLNCKLSENDSIKFEAYQGGVCIEVVTSADDPTIFLSAKDTDKLCDFLKEKVEGQ